MKPTPRTDAAFQRADTGLGLNQTERRVISLELLARTLERENAELLAALQNMLPMFDAAREHFTMLAFENASNKAHAAIAKATREQS